MKENNSVIDEDGEILKTYEQIVLDKLKNATELVCYNLDGGKIDVDYWNAEASNDEGLEDIVIACTNGTTFFYEDLMNSELSEYNELFINGHLIQII
jgi:hypothetical protein